MVRNRGVEQEKADALGGWGSWQQQGTTPGPASGGASDNMEEGGGRNCREKNGERDGPLGPRCQAESEETPQHRGEGGQNETD